MDLRADNKINFAAKEFGSKMEAGGYLRGGKKSIKERNRKVSPSFFFLNIYLFGCVKSVAIPIGQPVAAPSGIFIASCGIFC